MLGKLITIAGAGAFFAAVVVQLFRGEQDDSEDQAMEQGEGEHQTGNHETAGHERTGQNS
jgi:hypothetical protein